MRHHLTYALLRNRYLLAMLVVGALMVPAFLRALAILRGLQG